MTTYKSLTGYDAPIFYILLLSGVLLIWVPVDAIHNNEFFTQLGLALAGLALCFFIFIMIRSEYKSNKMKSGRIAE